MIQFRRKRREVPALNTASLPDLIFSVLFFFIIVTHMRQDDVRVRYRVPDGTQLQKLAGKQGVVHIYIGRTQQGKVCIQIADKMVDTNGLVDYVSHIRESMSPETAERLVVAISADRNVDMQTVMDVKQALRRANALKVTFIGTAVDKTKFRNGEGKGKIRD